MRVTMKISRGQRKWRYSTRYILLPINGCRTNVPTLHHSRDVSILQCA